MGTVMTSDKAQNIIEREAARLGMHFKKPVSLKDALDYLLCGDKENG